ncbi:MAG: alkaline phosphatase family protein [Candidatus Micrarchaeia archaeon]
MGRLRAIPLPVAAAFALLLALALFSAFSPPAYRPAQVSQRVIILGFDGMSPALLENWMAEGKLPNFSRLRALGGYSRMETTYPAQSPVAWASLETGTNPGKTRIFDFVRRDPQTYMPVLAVTEAAEGEALFELFGEKVRALPKISRQRQGTTLWNITSAAGIRTVVLRAPLSFPAEEVPGGRLLSGLGVPDLQGTWGSYSLFAEDAGRFGADSDTEFGGRIVRLDFSGATARGFLKGPKGKTAEVAFEKSGGAVKISLQGKTQQLRGGEWSEWFPISFTANFVFSIKGLVRFHVNSANPLEVYASPVVFDPREPVFPISYPADFSKQLANEIGTYKALGWPTDTWALDEGAISEKTFLEDLNATQSDFERGLFNQLGKRDWNFLFAVADTTDHLQHMFWRYLDPESPAYNSSGEREYGNEVFALYSRLDALVGTVMEGYLDGNTTLIVMSDHGFAPFRRSVNLNTWLVQNGFLRLKNQDAADSEKTLGQLFGKGEFWPNVDWRNSKAYALGLGEIYVNQKGREGKGNVSKSEAEGVKKRISEKLLQLRDPETNETIVSRVFDCAELYSGQYANDSCDLLVGFKEGYRVSWQTALGGMPPQVIEGNDRKWSGDHCSFDPALVPAALFSSRPLDSTDVRITDVAPSVLRVFGLPVPSQMDGQSFYDLPITNEELEQQLRSLGYLS